MRNFAAPLAVERDVDTTICVQWVVWIFSKESRSNLRSESIYESALRERERWSSCGYV